MKAVLAAIPLAGGASIKHSAVQTIRHAEPGEFTKRAFYNNRLDLPQIEALGDALSAETEQQRRLAVNGAGNQLGARYEKWRKVLLYARGELEALIDFSEDQHFDEMPDELISSVSKQVTALKREVSMHVENASKGELLRNGIGVALLGAPNAGKSSLLNRIVGHEAAIVSSEEGTTRDIVGVSVDIGGWLCRLCDMAGLRGAKSPHKLDPSLSPVGAIEEEGMKRAKARALTCDLVVVMLSLEKLKGSCIASLHIENELIEAVRECEKLEKPMVVVINKIDNLEERLARETLEQVNAEVKTIFPRIPPEHIFFISCLRASHQVSGDEDPGHIQNLLRGLQSYFTTLTTASEIKEVAFDKNYWGESLFASHRQSEHLQQCLGHLDDFLSQATLAPSVNDDVSFDIGVDIVAAAEHLRSAADRLAKITGRGEAGDVEDVLGVVFEQ